jgi:ribosome biogenesis GTPase
MRLLGIYDDDSGMGAVFADIEELAASCRFRSCRHDGEPGCAVTAAVDSDRLAGWRKLQRELAHAERKLDHQAARSEKARWKSIHKSARARRKIDPKFDP